VLGPDATLRRGYSLTWTRPAIWFAQLRRWSAATGFTRASRTGRFNRTSR